MKYNYIKLVILLTATVLFASTEPLHAGISVGAKVSASAGVYNDIQRPIPLMASPYVRSYPAVPAVAPYPVARTVVAPYPVARTVVAPYPVTRTVVVSGPQAVAVPTLTRQYAVPVVAGQSMAGVVGAYPYYYYPYAGQGSVGALGLVV